MNYYCNECDKVIADDQDSVATGDDHFHFDCFIKRGGKGEARVTKMVRDLSKKPRR